MPPPNYIEDKSNYFDQNIRRINEIIEHIRILSREQSAERFERFRVLSVIEKAVSMIEVQYARHNIDIRREIADADCHAYGNPHRFDQVILNLMVNAHDALKSKYDPYDDDQRIRISQRREGDTIRIEVEDNGVGIPDAARSHIFDPFFTTKGEQDGTGLGLSISYGIIREMKGEIQCESEPGEFTCMILTIPEQTWTDSHRNAPIARLTIFIDNFSLRYRTLHRHY